MSLLPKDDVLINTTNKIFIVSLPRTGTKSLIKMLRVLGYKAEHCPSVRLETNILQKSFDAFADTPIYRPSVYSKLAVQPSNKFIYIDRTPIEWVDSFQRTKLHDAYLDYQRRGDTIPHRISKLDRDSYFEVFREQHQNPATGNFENGIWCPIFAMEQFKYHRQMVLSTIVPEQLLVYKFEQGWEPICNFLGKEIPNIQIPHLNKNDLFEKII
jgi:hypothetical protein